ncbi:MAG: DUF493 domain-containing protein [Usitatibacter sp.]
MDATLNPPEEPQSLLTFGRYLSITVNLNARSRAQLDALYSEFSKHPRVMMVY